MNNRQCKKCLLNESGGASYETVKSYLDNLDNELKVDDETYKYRLSQCKECDELISGMCLKCGCYVEIRAALKNKKCACYDNIRWNSIN